MSEKNSKSTHFDVLKVITTVLVVFAHASRMYTGEGVVTPSLESPVLNYITKFIYAFHMPLFIGISGMVYGYCVDDLGKYNNTIDFLLNKGKRLLIPYLVFGLAYVAPVMVFFHFTDSSYIKYCIGGLFFVQNSRHLWYIIVLFEIFFVCAFLRKLLLKKNLILEILVIILLFGISFFSGHLTGKFAIATFANYLIYFYLGFLFNRYYDRIVKIIKNPITIVLMVIAYIFLLEYSFKAITILNSILGSCILIGVTSYFPESFMKKKQIAKANKNGFGIYLFHPMIIYVLFYYFGPKQIHPMILCFGITIFAYIASWLLTDLIRILKLSIIIGESKKAKKRKE